MIGEAQGPRGFSEFRTGWMVLIGCLFGVGVGLTGLPFYSFGIFMKPLAAEFGWSRSAIGAGFLCISSGTVVIGPFLGPLIDRVGVRRLATLSLLGLSCGFLLLSHITADIRSFYGAWLVATIFGSATTPLTWTRAVSLRFEKRRGLALGMMLLGTGLSGIVAPPLLQKAIGAYGWRGAYVAIGLFIACIVAPIVWLALKGSDDRHLVARAARTGMTRREALRTRQFWTVGAAIFLVSLAQGGTTVHLPALLGDSGFAPDQIALALSLLGISVVVGRVTVGYIIDSLYPPYVAGVFFALPALTLAILFNAPGAGQVYGAAILLGLAAGAEVDLLSFFIGRYFGLRSYGAIYSVALTCFASGAGLGPLLTGYMFDRDHSYHPAILCGIALYLGSAALIATMGKPRILPAAEA